MCVYQNIKDIRAAATFTFYARSNWLRPRVRDSASGNDDGCGRETSGEPKVGRDDLAGVERRQRLKSVPEKKNGRQGFLLAFFCDLLIIIGRRVSRATTKVAKQPKSIQMFCGNFCFFRFFFLLNCCIPGEH